MYLCIAGNIGVGKTTLVRLLADRFHWKPYYESVGNNPFLEDFYRNRSRWSFATQISFLGQRFQAHLAVQKAREFAILDRSLFEDGEVFAKTAFHLGWMTNHEYRTYLDLYQLFLGLVEAPSFIVYLRCSVENLLHRIGKRGRHYEKQIPVDYLRALQAAYEDWAQSSRSQIITIDTDFCDYSLEGKTRDEILRRISNHFLSIPRASMDRHALSQ